MALVCSFAPGIHLGSGWGSLIAFWSVNDTCNENVFGVCVFCEQHGLWPLKCHFHPQYNAEVMSLGDSKGMANMLVVSILC